MNIFTFQVMFRTLATALLVAAPSFAQATPVLAANANSSSVVYTTNDFAFSLYRHLALAPGDNVFFSPYSVSTALAMTWAGARGDTAAQMAKALGLDKLPIAAVASAFGQLQQSLGQTQTKASARLVIANSLWPQLDHPIQPDYVKLIQGDFAADITPVDYKIHVVDTIQHINAWVEDKTAKRINKLLHPGDVGPDTRLILVNAIYFKGNWAEKFDTAATAPALFITADGKSKTIPFMHHKMNEARFAEVPGAPVPLQMLTLPYQDKELEFVALLPKSPRDLPVLEKNISTSQLIEWLGKLSAPRAVEVFLPKFKLEQRYSLVPPLQALGISDAFTNQADFSGMDGARDLYVGGIIHQAFVEVNEEGTEAAAATSVGMRTLAVQVTPVFRADHPFIFLIRDPATGSILFMGRLSNPE